MGYAVQTLLHEKGRYLPGVLAVSFSAVLMALQFGLLIGLFEITSIPIDHTDPRNVWVGSKDVKSVDLGRPIKVSYIGRVAGRPGVRPPEEFVANFANFTRQDGGTDLCFLLGSSLEPDAAGAADVLTPELRHKLTLPFTIVVDESDLERLGLHKPDAEPKINGQKVTLVGTVRGLKSLAAPWVFCSVPTAKQLLRGIMDRDQATYLLLQADTVERAAEVARELQDDYPGMMVRSAEEFSFASRKYWLLRTKAGIAIGYAALLGLFVGALVTMQTLYAATMASAREFATLFALGIPRRKVYGMVFLQAFWVGVFGVLLAYPVVLLLAYGAKHGGANVVLRWEVLAGAAGVTLGTAMVAGLFALRSVRTIEPMSLLR